MSIRDTRAGFTQAKFNEDAIGIVGLEIVALAIAVGIGKSSWWWGGGIFLGGMVIINIPVLNILFSLVMTAAWGLVGYVIGEAIGHEGANWVIGTLAGLVSLGAHLGAIEYAEDIARKD